MRQARILCAIVFLNVVFTGVWPGQVQAQELTEQEGYLNVRVRGNLVRLEAFFVRMKESPNGLQQLPAALITHGRPASNGRMTDMRARDIAMHARDFARRGYLGVVVMRRGFGRSDGPAPPPPTSCGSKTFAEHFEAGADDLEGALGVLAQRPDVDAQRMIAIGASEGGAAVLMLAARNPRGLLGVINVSGGLRMAGCARDELLVAPIAEAGGRAKVKTLWIYAENDSYFPPGIVDKMHEGFLASGGDVRRVRVPAMGADGHTMFNTLIGRRLWLAEADALLRDVGLPTWTHVNVLGLLKALRLPDTQRPFIEHYFSAPGEKALAKSLTSDRMFLQFGAPDLAAVRARVVRTCESREPRQECEIAVENAQLSLSGGKGWIFGLSPPAAPGLPAPGLPAPGLPAARPGTSDGKSNE